MKINCIWEHNGNDTLLYAENCVGAFTRGENVDVALQKMKSEIHSYAAWAGEKIDGGIEPVIVQEKDSELEIKDADSDVLFRTEEEPLTMEEYVKLRDLALKSAADFLKLYEAIPDKNASALQMRKTFYGQVPRTAEEMYLHTKNVNSYYFGEIGVEADNEGTILRCRKRGFEQLESMADVDELYEVLSDESVMIYIESVFDREQTKEFIQAAGMCESPLVYAVVWKLTGKVIGHAIFHPYEENNYEIGWILNKEYWGKGIADELTKELIKYARLLVGSGCIIECDAKQNASKSIALKNGFAYEGTIDNLERYRLII